MTVRLGMTKGVKEKSQSKTSLEKTGNVLPTSTTPPCCEKQKDVVIVHLNTCETENHKNGSIDHTSRCELNDDDTVLNENSLIAKKKKKKKRKKDHQNSISQPLLDDDESTRVQIKDDDDEEEDDDDDEDEDEKEEKERDEQINEGHHIPNNLLHFTHHPIGLFHSMLPENSSKSYEYNDDEFYDDVNISDVRNENKSNNFFCPLILTG